MGDGYEVLVSQSVRQFIDELDEQSARIVEENLAKLSEPFPGRGQGDKEAIEWRGESVFRIHIGRTWTAFYDIDRESEVVRVLDVMSIDRAHREYGDLG